MATSARSSSATDCSRRSSSSRAACIEAEGRARESEGGVGGRGGKRVGIEGIWQGRGEEGGVQGGTGVGCGWLGRAKERRGVRRRKKGLEWGGERGGDKRGEGGNGGLREARRLRGELETKPAQLGPHLGQGGGVFQLAGKVRLRR